MQPKAKLRLEQLIGYLKECLAKREGMIDKLMKVMAGPKLNINIDRCKLFNSLVSAY